MICQIFESMTYTKKNSVDLRRKGGNHKGCTA